MKYCNNKIYLAAYLLSGYSWSNISVLNGNACERIHLFRHCFWKSFFYSIFARFSCLFSLEFRAAVCRFDCSCSVQTLTIFSENVSDEWILICLKICFSYVYVLMGHGALDFLRLSCGGLLSSGVGLSGSVLQWWRQGWIPTAGL